MPGPKYEKETKGIEIHNKYEKFYDKYMKVIYT